MGMKVVGEDDRGGGGWEGRGSSGGREEMVVDGKNERENSESGWKRKKIEGVLNVSPPGHITIKL